MIVRGWGGDLAAGRLGGSRRAAVRRRLASRVFVDFGVVSGGCLLAGRRSNWANAPLLFLITFIGQKRVVPGVFTRLR